MPTTHQTALCVKLLNGMVGREHLPTNTSDSSGPARSCALEMRGGDDMPDCGLFGLECLAYCESAVLFVDTDWLLDYG